MPELEAKLVGGKHGLEPIGISTTGAGTIAKGARTVVFNNTGAGAATVSGVSLASGDIMTYPAVAGEVYQEISYDGSGTTLIITGAR